jgi:DNA polymerase-3 subunit alpha
MTLEVTEDFLKKEKEMVGIYLSSHPLDRFSFEMKHFTSHSLQEIAEILEKAQSEENFLPGSAAGRLGYQRNLCPSKNSGRPWGTFTVEDYTSPVNLPFLEKNTSNTCLICVKGKHCL